VEEVVGAIPGQLQQQFNIIILRKMIQTQAVGEVKRQDGLQVETIPVVVHQYLPQIFQEVIL
jgi:hypothetical protein